MSSGRLFGAEEIEENYNKTRGYSNLTMHIQIRKTPIDGVISIAVNNFSKWAFKVPDTLLDRAENEEM